MLDLIYVGDKFYPCDEQGNIINMKNKINKIKLPKNALTLLQKMSVESYLEVCQEEQDNEIIALNLKRQSVITNWMDSLYTGKAKIYKQHGVLNATIVTSLVGGLAAAFAGSPIMFGIGIGAAAVASCGYLITPPLPQLSPSNELYNLLKNEFTRPLTDYYVVPEEYKVGAKVKRINSRNGSIKVGTTAKIIDVNRVRDEIVLQHFPDHNNSYKNLQIVGRKKK